MAWLMEVTEISGEVPGVDDEGSPITIDLTLEGRFRATVKYFDDADPATIILTQSFDFGFGVTGAEALEKFRKAGRRVRDSRQLIADLQINVGQPLTL